MHGDRPFIKKKGCKGKVMKSPLLSLCKIACFHPNPSPNFFLDKVSVVVVLFSVIHVPICDLHRVQTHDNRNHFQNRLNLKFS